MSLLKPAKDFPEWDESRFPRLSINTQKRPQKSTPSIVQRTTDDDTIPKAPPITSNDNDDGDKQSPHMHMQEIMHSSKNYDSETPKNQMIPKYPDLSCPDAPFVARIHHRCCNGNGEGRHDDGEAVKREN